MMLSLMPQWLFDPCQAQEDLILEHLANDHVIRQVSNIKSEELESGSTGEAA